MSSVSEMDELMNALELGDRVSNFINTAEFRYLRLIFDVKGKIVKSRWI